MKKLYNLILNVVLGVFDAVFPKVDNSIQTIQSEFYHEDSKIVVNWVRFTATLLTFIVLVLNFFHLVTIDDIIRILETIPE